MGCSSSSLEQHEWEPQREDHGCEGPVSGYSQRTVRRGLSKGSEESYSAPSSPAASPPFSAFPPPFAAFRDTIGTQYPDREDGRLRTMGVAVSGYNGSAGASCGRPMPSC